jgi:molybdopterin converting factor small subunit
MKIKVRFFSYFKDLAGADETVVTLATGATIAELTKKVHAKFPKLAGTARSTLVAVGVEYAAQNQVLNPEDEVSFFPPVQGG